MQPASQPKNPPAPVPPAHVSAPLQPPNAGPRTHLCHAGVLLGNELLRCLGHTLQLLLVGLGKGEVAVQGVQVALQPRAAALLHL